MNISGEVETPRAATGSQGSAAAAATAAASPAHFVAHKNNRSTSEPVHRQQQLLNMQRHAEMLRQRSQTQGVPERIRLDGGGGSPTGSHKSERVASSRPEGVRRRQRDPFAAGRPMKAASEQGYSTYARDPERTVTLEKEKPSQLTPEAAVGLDLSYLSSYK